MWNARRQAVIGGLLLAGGFGLPAQARSRNAPRLVAERFASTLSAHDMDGFAALFADDYINHQASAAAPAPKDTVPKQATIGFFKARLAGIPDLTVTIETVVAAEDKVAASFVYSGTHQGTYFGIAPTGRTLHFTSCDIFKVKSGRIAEHWGMGDIAGVMAQLKG